MGGQGWAVRSSRPPPERGVNHQDVNRVTGDFRLKVFARPRLNQTSDKYFGAGGITEEERRGDFATATPGMTPIQALWLLGGR